MNITTDASHGLFPAERSRFQQFSNKAAFVCALCFVFFIPISPALMNIFLFFTLIFILLAGNLRNHLYIVCHNAVSKAGIFLFLLLAIGITWSTANIKESLLMLNKYNELWYIALLMPIFLSAQRKALGLNIFLASMLFILVLVYSIYLGLIPNIPIPSKAHPLHTISVSGGFRTNIITNILMSFAVFILLQRALLTKNNYKWTYTILFFLSANYSLFISNGTTGQILTIALIMLTLIQHMRWKSIIVIPLFFGVIVSHAYIYENSSINTAVIKLKSGIEHDGTSASQRREFLANSIYLFKKNPYIGTGTGSFYKSYTQIPPHRILTTPSKNPHNEYSSFAIQLGAVGIIGLLLLFTSQGISSFHIISTEQRYLAQGLVVFIVLSSLGNTMIMDSGEGHFWAYMSAIFFSPLYKQHSQSTNANH